MSWCVYFVHCFGLSLPFSVWKLVFNSERFIWIISLTPPTFHILLFSVIIPYSDAGWISWTDHLIFFFYISSFCILCSISWEVSSALSSIPFFEFFIWYIFNAGERFYFYLFFLRVCIYSCFVDEISSSLRIDGYVNNRWWFNRYVWLLWLHGL